MRIWFNHWFSTAYHLIQLIRDGDPGRFCFLGSGTNPHAVYREACDEWYPEEDLDGEAYAAFCLDFCAAHQVDIFAPRRRMADVVEHAAEFQAMGVHLLADPQPGIVRMLDDKLETYRFFEEHLPACVPDYRAARSLGEFLEAYASLREIWPRICYKLAVDEGARSFRVIDEAGAGSLLDRPGAKVTLDAARAVLAGYDFQIPVLLMPYLGGVEISADCLATPSGPLVLPRYKRSGRYSEVILDAQVQALCTQIMEQLGLRTPMNVQFRIHEDKPLLLEINPRMSGGLQLSCKAAGINLPSIAIHQLLGEEEAWAYPTMGVQRVAHIETPILLS